MSEERMDVADRMPDAIAEACAHEREVRAAAEERCRNLHAGIAEIAHDLRGPLAAVAAWVEIARAPRSTRRQVDEAFRVIRRNIAAQQRLLDDMMDAARIALGKLELDLADIPDLAPLVAEVAATFAPLAAARSIALDLDLRPASGPVGADRARLRQVLVNLLTNAIKFTPRGGRVTLSCFREGGDVALRVRDTGAGILAENLDRIFDRYAQGEAGRSAGRGLGLGLSIVRALVALHGGTVRAQSAGPGQGATFTVRLPRRA
jgi:signal transduction histidine kinase